MPQSAVTDVRAAKLSELVRELRDFLYEVQPLGKQSREWDNIYELVEEIRRKAQLIESAHKTLQ